MTRELDKARAVKERLATGNLVLAAQIGLTDPAVVEILGDTGFDVLVIDTEHGPYGPESVQAMLQAGVSGGAVVLARPLRLDPDLIRLYLDLGSPGVLCPFIETREQAELLVSSCRYPPAGRRGYGPRRASRYGGAAVGYFESANDCVLCIPIIESSAAIENVDEIVSVDGIDTVCIGPVDLSISLGVPMNFESVAYLEAFAAVKEACIRQGKPFGTGAYSLEHARACRDHGTGFLLTFADDQALRSGALATVEALRGLQGAG
jgi:2-keto-3-deoxy-L-rhamnonate aldolase RhmA